jgi:hypothetical protein
MSGHSVVPADARRRGRRFAFFRAPSLLSLFSAVICLVGSAGCGGNGVSGPGSDLSDTTGVIVGRLDFGSGAPVPYPRAWFLLRPAGPRECVERFGAIAVLGSMNNWNISRAPDYVMSRLQPCLWARAMAVPGGLVEFKFVTGANEYTVTFDNPPDYGRLDANVGTDPLAGDLDSPAPGAGGNVSVTVPSAGTRVFVLDEAADPPHYALVSDTAFARSDSSDGSFRISGVTPGTYGIFGWFEGRVLLAVDSVEVSAGHVTDLGTLAVEEPLGRLSGRVAFADSPDPLPTATVTLRYSGSSTIRATAQVTDDFAFDELSPGLYDVGFQAQGYIDTTLTGMEIASGSEKNVGTVVLQPGCRSAFSTIQLSSDFTSFDLSQAPQMTQGPACVWTDTVTVEAGGPYNLKFVTDGYFDSPQDYGGDESVTLQLPGSYPVWPVSGIGTAVNVAFSTSGMYEFLLDETEGRFTATLLEAGAN